MKQWYLQLNARERKLLHWCGLVFIIPLWLFVYQPVNNSLDNNKKRLAELDQQFQLMQQLSATVSDSTQVASVSPLSSGVTFSTWLDRQLESRELMQFVRRAEPVDTQTSTLWLQNVPFDNTMDWLQEIQEQFSVNIQQLDAVATDRANGLATIRLTLSIQG
ncbi:type II secretion system protein GspM [Marinicella sp. W31]|uniref:type II secretion system protein GspM n=1 Tax=Marinicella sp. W31 TaxID=3023713 RepID=UPI0037571A10